MPIKIKEIFQVQFICNCKACEASKNPATEVYHGETLEDVYKLAELNWSFKVQMHHKGYETMAVAFLNKHMEK